MILAIDPGKAGGLAWVHDGHVACRAMPETDGDVLDAILEITALPHTGRVCFVERVGGFVKGGGAGRQPGSAMFKFGDGCGFLRGTLMALNWRLIYVLPQAWQKGFALGKRSECASDNEWKNKLKAEAQRRFPALQVTLKTSDALLILDYARGCEISKK